MARVAFDDDHPCPACGWAWKTPVQFPKFGRKFSPHEVEWEVPEGGGWCSNRDCPMTDDDRQRFRELRRAKGWDPS